MRANTIKVLSTIRNADHGYGWVNLNETFKGPSDINEAIKLAETNYLLVLSDGDKRLFKKLDNEGLYVRLSQKGKYILEKEQASENNKFFSFKYKVLLAVISLLILLIRVGFDKEEKVQMPNFHFADSIRFDLDSNIKARLRKSDSSTMN